MNLYRIEFLHAAPKDIEYGLKCLLLAENDEEVYEWIASEPEIGDASLYNRWKECENYVWDDELESFVDENGYQADEWWYDENGNIIPFKEKMLKVKGQMNDDDYEYNDAYYGITLYGWKLIKENVTTDYSELMELDIVFKA